MKTKATNILLFGLLLFVISSTIHAQCTNFDALVRGGNDLFRSNNFFGAINKYQAAITDCPTRADEANAKVRMVFNKVEEMRQGAEAAKALALQAKQNADSARQAAEASQQRADSANAATQQALRELAAANAAAERAIADAITDRNSAEKARDYAEQMSKDADRARKATEDAMESLTRANSARQKLLDAFYFFEDSLALTYEGGNFGFVNKSGEYKIRPKFDQAGVFESPGYALVEERNNSYAINTSGQQYLSAYDIEQIDSATEAVVMKGLAIAKLPEVFRQKNLKVLVLKSKIADDVWPSGKDPNPTAKDLLYYQKANKAIVSKQDSINDVIRSEIWKLKFLEILAFESYNLDSVSPRIQGMRNLTRLSLRGNQIRTFPIGIGKLNNLVSLDLGYNNLSSFPEQILSLSKLRCVRIGRNPCTATEKQRQDIQNLMRRKLPNCKVYFD